MAFQFHLVVWLALWGAAAAWAETSPSPAVEKITRKLQSGERLTVATFGDSITWPCFHTDFRQNYITFTIDALRKQFPNANVEIVHAGNMGGVARGLANGRFERYVLARHPDAVVLMFGMNDCLAGEPGLDSFDRDLTALVNMARKQGVLPIIATQNEILYESQDGRARRALPLYMARALQVAAREQIPAADCFALWKPLAEQPGELAARLNDWIHPNHAGHRLMAKAILKTFWPEAAEYVSDAVRPPLRPEQTAPTPCLLPGPRGKQVLRTRAGVWVALTGQKRNDRLVDLVFSCSRKANPLWTDFEHVTLTGPGQDAVFDNMDRNLTGALLLEQENRVWVVFSWPTGVFAVSVDLESAERQVRLDEQQSWLKMSDTPFARPMTLIHSLTGDGQLHDAYLQADGWPAVFCTTRNLAAHAGWEIADGEDGIVILTNPPADSGDDGYDFRFPGFHSVRCVRTDNHPPHWAAQKTAGEFTLLGQVGSKRTVAPLVEVTELMLPDLCAPGRLFGVVAYPPDAENRWAVVEWSDALVFRDLAYPKRASSRKMLPLPWSDGTRNGVYWAESPGDGPQRQAPAYESRLQPGAVSLGIVTAERERLVFTIDKIDADSVHE